MGGGGRRPRPPMILGGGRRPSPRIISYMTPQIARTHTDPYTGACGVPWGVRCMSPKGAPGRSREGFRVVSNRKPQSLSTPLLRTAEHVNFGQR